MNYFLILIAAILFTVQTLCFKEFNKRYMKNIASYFLFNFLYFSVVAIILLKPRDAKKPRDGDAIHFEPRCALHSEETGG